MYSSKDSYHIETRHLTYKLIRLVGFYMLGGFAEEASFVTFDFFEDITRLRICER